jgi:hypothetical protein
VVSEAADLAAKGIGAGVKASVQLAGMGLRQIPKLAAATGKGILKIPAAVGAVKEGAHRVAYTAGAVGMDGLRWGTDKTVGRAWNFVMNTHGDKWIPFAKQIAPWYIGPVAWQNFASAGHKLACLKLRRWQFDRKMTEEQKNYWAIDDVGGETCVPANERTWKPFD